MKNETHSKREEKAGITGRERRKQEQEKVGRGIRKEKSRRGTVLNFSRRMTRSPPRKENEEKRKVAEENIEEKIKENTQAEEEEKEKAMEVDRDK